MPAGPSQAASYAARCGLAPAVVPRPLAARRGRGGDALRFRRYLLGFGLAAPPMLAYLVRHRPQTLTEGQALLAAGVVVLGFLPALVYLARGARSPLPLLPLSGLFYAATFGLPAFSEDLGWFSVPPRAVTRAFVLTLAGVLAMYGAYVVSGRLLFRRLRPVRIPGSLSPARLRALAWIAFAAHLAYQFTPALQRLPSVGNFFPPLGWVAIGLLYLSHLEGRLPAAHAVVFFAVAMPLELISRLASGALYEFFVVIVFMSLIYWQVRRRVPWMVLLAAAGLFVLLNDVKHEYRGRLAFGGLESTSVLERVTAFAQLLTERYGDLDGPADATISSVNRLGHIAQFAYVVEATPDAVPYWGGETYVYLLASSVPRFLWPEKPSSGFGNEFGRRYRLLMQRNFETTVNVPWLTEFYINFGPKGVVLGMALVGVGFRFLIQKLTNPSNSPAEYVLGLSLVFQLFYSESNLAILWGGLLLTFVSLYLTLRLASLRLRG